MRGTLEVTDMIAQVLKPALRLCLLLMVCCGGQIFTGQIFWKHNRKYPSRTIDSCSDITKEAKPLLTRCFPHVLEHWMRDNLLFFDISQKVGKKS